MDKTVDCDTERIKWDTEAHVIFLSFVDPEFYIDIYNSIYLYPLIVQGKLFKRAEIVNGKVKGERGQSIGIWGIAKAHYILMWKYLWNWVSCTIKMWQ